MNKEAWLETIERGFGGDVAVYELKNDIHKRARIAVGWAMLLPYRTIVWMDDSNRIFAEFIDEHYIQPPEALTRLGYEVHGTIDFAQAISAT